MSVRTMAIAIMKSTTIGQSAGKCSSEMVSMAGASNAVGLQRRQDEKRSRSPATRLQSDDCMASATDAARGCARILGCRTTTRLNARMRTNLSEVVGEWAQGSADATQDVLAESTGREQLSERPTGTPPATNTMKTRPALGSSIR